MPRLRWTILIMAAVVGILLWPLMGLLEATWAEPPKSTQVTFDLRSRIPVVANQEAAAQDLPIRPFERSSTSGLVRVLVVESEKGDPVSGATVFADSGHQVRTNREGLAEFDTRVGSVVALHPAFVQSAVTPINGASASLVRVVLDRGVTLTCEFRDALTRLPVANLEVLVTLLPEARFQTETKRGDLLKAQAPDNVTFRGEWSESGSGFRGTRVAVTDERGVCQVTGLLPGPVAVMIGDRSYLICDANKRIVPAVAPGQIKVDVSPVFVRVIDIRCSRGCNSRQFTPVGTKVPAGLELLVENSYPSVFEHARSIIDRVAPHRPGTMNRLTFLYCARVGAVPAGHGLESPVYIGEQRVDCNVVPLNYLHPTDVASYSMIHDCGQMGRVVLRPSPLHNFVPVMVETEKKSVFDPEMQAEGWTFEVPYGRYRLGNPSIRAQIEIDINSPFQVYDHPESTAVAFLRLRGRTKSGFPTSAWIVQTTSGGESRRGYGWTQACDVAVSAGRHEVKISDLAGQEQWKRVIEVDPAKQAVHDIEFVIE